MLSSERPSESLKKFLCRELVGKKILDVGCGAGSMVFYLAARFPHVFMGIDVEPAHIRAAKKRAKKFSGNGNVLFCAGNFCLKKFGGKFDSVLLVHSLHHFGDAVRVLAKARSVLRKRGKILVAEYTRDAGERLDSCPRFSGKKIKTLLKKTGFRRVKKCSCHTSLETVTGYNP